MLLSGAVALGITRWFTSVRNVAPVGRPRRPAGVRRRALVVDSLDRARLGVRTVVRLVRRITASVGPSINGQGRCRCKSKRLRVSIPM